MNRDEERLREFMDQNGELNSSMDYVTLAHRALGEAKSRSPPSVYSDIDAARHILSRLKTQLNNERPGLVMKQAGAKHQASDKSDGFTDPDE